MAKVKKAALAFVLAAVAAVSLLCVGCSGGGAELKGIYCNSIASYSTIEQGYLVSTYNTSLSVYTDNTFTANAVQNTLYSSDGSSFNPTFFGIYTLYGTYEVVSEDDVLNETTIKIAGVTAVESADGMTEKAAFSAELTAALNADIIGKEVILQADLQLSESLSVNSLYGVLR